MGEKWMTRLFSPQFSASMKHISTTNTMLRTAVVRLAMYSVLNMVIASAQCSTTCAGTTANGTSFDLSALMGQDFQTVGSDQNADTYFLNVCGTSATHCPDDSGDPAVTQGMAAQTVSAGGCYILGVSLFSCSVLGVI